MAKLKLMLVGKPRDLADPSIFHIVSLVAFLAWVGLGADGLSSLFTVRPKLSHCPGRSCLPGHLSGHGQRPPSS